MNELIKIFETDNLNALKEIEQCKLGFGYVYALEWGNTVKVGSTAKLSIRIAQLKTVANYGGIVTGRLIVSPFHTNYRENEKMLHGYFKNVRVKGTELFKTDIANVASKIGELAFFDELPTNPKAEKFIEKLIDVLKIPTVEELTTVSKNPLGYKYYIKLLDKLNIPIASNQVFVNCEECGEEMDVSLKDVIDEDGCLMEDSTWFCCPECHKKWLFEKKEGA